MALCGLVASNSEEDARLQEAGGAGTLRCDVRITDLECFTRLVLTRYTSGLGPDLHPRGLTVAQGVATARNHFTTSHDGVIRLDGSVVVLVIGFAPSDVAIVVMIVILRRSGVTVSYRKRPLIFGASGHSKVKSPNEELCTIVVFVHEGPIFASWKGSCSRSSLVMRPFVSAWLPALSEQLWRVPEIREASGLNRPWENRSTAKSISPPKDPVGH
jgi:hypothetical protein